MDENLGRGLVRRDEGELEEEELEEGKWIKKMYSGRGGGGGGKMD